MASLRVLGVLNGRDLPEDEVLAWARSAEVVYAADGGAERLLKGGLTPIIVGDLDSLDPSLIPAGARLVEVKDQDSSDCDKLLNLASQDRVSQITMVGLEGDRLDHVVASLFSLVGRRKSIRVVLRQGMGYVVPCGSSFSIPAKPGGTFSVLPLTLCWGITLTGAEWELMDAELRPGLHASLSNRAVERPILNLSGGTCLVIVSDDELKRPHWPSED